ncbi:MAG: cation-transporting P-type ATPase [Chloroflexi bacterium]|nr:cation-transporting P-type ATPase [Chloroflexota bacterium]
MNSQPIHALSIPDVYLALESSPDGLTPEEAQARLSLYGTNVVREPPLQPLWRRFAGHVTHLMALLLWAAVALSVAGGRVALGSVIFIVVLVNAAFSFWQEYRAERAVAALKKILPAYARVARAGQEMKTLAGEIVPGDVLVLAEGDNIPADARVVEEYGLRTNNAILTGEAMPVRKTADASLRDGLTELERSNLVFAGTSVVSGTGRAVVFATGMVTQFGRIANLTQTVPEEPSSLQRGIAQVTRLISLVAIGIGVIVLLDGLLDATIPDIEAFILAIGIIVAAVPEGLLPTVTLSLARAVQRLAGRGVLVKKLASVETLGNVSVICTDKSGTLTQNQMTVRDLWVSGHRLTVSGVGYEPTGAFTPSPVGAACESDFNTLSSAALLCNNARLTAPSVERPQWTALGDQTEAALLVMALKGGADPHAVSALFPRIHELPFDARRKRMSTIHRDTLSGSEVAFVKGAPREVLQLCSQVLLNGQARPLDNKTRADILAANDDYARNALRVLALARRELPSRSGAYVAGQVEQGLTFLGLVAMMDPPRLEVAAAVRACHQAGIRMVMITGDYGLTAESLARRVGMLPPNAPAPRIITGAEVDAMSDADLQAALGGTVLCARMAPEHKLRLVSAFQARGDVVAVSGDGVNDAPALRKADIGIAMGITGTDVAKEAADVILTDDNFAAIVTAIEEGRAVYDNLRKFIAYIFASNVPEIFPFILTSLFNIPLALTVLQILAIDLGSDLLPALALGTEKPEPNVMRRPPRRRSQPLLDRGLFLRSLVWLGGIETALCYGGFFAVYYLAGYIDLAHLPHSDWLPFAQRLATPEGRVYSLATTVFYAGVVAAQIGNAYACRTETDRVRGLGLFSNRYLIVGILTAGAIMLSVIYVPPLATLFGHLPIPLPYWPALALYAPLLYVLDRIRKTIARRVQQARRQKTLAAQGGLAS